MAADAESLKLVEANKLVDGVQMRRRRYLFAAGSVFVILTVVTALAYSALLNARMSQERAMEQAQIARLSALQAERDAEIVRRSLPVKAIGADASISEEGWLIRGGNPIKRITTGPVDIAVFAPNRDEFAVASADGVFVGRASSPDEIYPVPVNARATSLNFSPDGLRMVTTTRDGATSLWDVATRNRLAEFRTAAHDATAAVFSPDALLVAVGTNSGNVRLWNVSTGQEVRSFTTVHSVRSIAFSDDGQKLLIGFQGGGASVVDIATGETLARFSG